MSKYQDIMGRINYGLFLIVVFLLPFPQIALRYTCVLWITSWLFEGRWTKRENWKLGLEDWRSVLPFVLFGLWYGWRLLSGLWATDHAAWSSQMERYITFGALVPVGLWGVNSRYDWRQIGRVLIAGCVAAIPFYLILMGTLYLQPEIIYARQWSIPWDYDYTSFLSFFARNISVFKHRLFLCSVELLSGYMAFILYRHRPKILMLILLIITAFIVLSGSRQIILTAVAIVIVVLLFSLPVHSRKRYGIGIALVGMAIGAGLLCLHPRMRNFSPDFITEIHDYETDDFVRLNIWQVALQEPHEYAIWGLGAGQSTSYLAERYQLNGLDQYTAKRYNCHNQYLEELMELGVAGLVLFLLMWLSIPLCARPEARQAACVFVVLFLCNMTTECMFGRFCGIALWAVGMVFLLMPINPLSGPQTSLEKAREVCRD